MADDEQDRLRASGHPVRLRMLSLLTGAELSATEVAQELGLTHANASYHLRVLERAGLLEIASEERVRGGLAKRYRHPWQTDLGPAKNAQDADMFVRAAAEELVRRYRLRKRGAKGSASDAELWVPAEIWEQARDLVEQASRLLHANARPPRTDGTVHANLTAFIFQMGEGG